MAENKPQPPAVNLPPPSQPFPGSLTPGWNDPPKCSPTVSQGHGHSRLNLKKRVAFPLQGMGAGTPDTSATKPMAVVQPSGVLPPKKDFAAQPQQPVAVVHPISTIQATSISNDNLPIEAQEFTLRSLRERVPKVEESINVRREEIERRLGYVENMWTTHKLSGSVQQKLYTLANAMLGDNYNEAMQTYTTLATNHFSECNPFIAALRHLVLTLNKNDDSTTIPNAESSVSTSEFYLNSSNVIPMIAPANDRGLNVGIVSGILRQTNPAVEEDSHVDLHITSRGSVQHI